MPFKIFIILFPKSTIVALHATKNNSVTLKICNQARIEQLGVSTVRLRHKDKTAKCRFFVVPGGSPVLLRMSDIELLDILKTTCEVK